MAKRCTLLAVFGLCFLSGQLQAQTQEDKVLEKTRSEWLKILAEHKEVKYRRAAIIALTVFPKSKEILMGLAQALDNDADAEVRREIAATLGSFGEQAKGIVHLVAKHLEKDDSPKVREACARALGKLADHSQGFVANLGRALKDSSPGTRAAAAEALVSFGDTAKQVLPQVTDAAMDAKLELLTRLYAVQILGKQGRDEEKTAPLLAAILADRNAPHELRQAAVTGLSNMGPTAAGSMAVLVETIEDQKPGKDQSKEQVQELRRLAAVALGKIGDKAVAAAPTVLKILHDPEVGVRYQAVRLAGTVGKGNPAIARELLELLNSEKNAEILLAVMQETAELDIREAVPRLRVLTSDARNSIRQGAGEALKKLQK